MKKYASMAILLIITLIRLYSVYFLQVTDSKNTIKKRTSQPANLQFVKNITKNITTKVQDSMPKIPADLLLGMTIGVDTIKQNKVFYQNLITTGLVHVVVVSGYNVALVINFISKIFYQKLRITHKLFILLFLLGYVVLCGLQAPVIRAALMGYIAYLASTEGRGLEALNLLVFVCLLMLCLNPVYIESLSFWLSTLATLGLMFYQKTIHIRLESFFKPFSKYMSFVPLEDLSSSLACQITVWPIISYFFGRVSWISPLYNLFVLWLIPICTVLGFLYLVILFILPQVSGAAGLFIVPFYDIFVRAINFFTIIDKGSANTQISLPFFICYYLSLALLTILFKRISTHENEKIKTIVADPCI